MVSWLSVSFNLSFLARSVVLPLAENHDNCSALIVFKVHEVIVNLSVKYLPLELTKLHHPNTLKYFLPPTKQPPSKYSGKSFIN